MKHCGRLAAVTLAAALRGLPGPAQRIARGRSRRPREHRRSARLRSAPPSSTNSPMQPPTARSSSSAPAPRPATASAATSRPRRRGRRDQGRLCLGRVRFPEAPGQAPGRVQAPFRLPPSRAPRQGSPRQAGPGQHGRDRRVPDAPPSPRRPRILRLAVQTAEVRTTSRRGDAVTHGNTPKLAAHRQPSMYCDGFISLLRPLRPAAQGLWRCAAGCYRSHKAKVAFMKLVAGNSNRPLAEAISAYLNIPLAKCSGEALRGHGGLRRDPGECARRGCLHHPVDLVPHERPPDGAADHHAMRCAGPRPAASRR